MKHDPLSVSNSNLWEGVDATEAVLDGYDDKVLNLFALVALGWGDMRDGFTITAVKSKDSADFLCVVAASFKGVRKPKEVRVLHGNVAVIAMSIDCNSMRSYGRRRVCTILE